MRINADLDACEGYLSCVTEAPEVFDVSDDGTVAVLHPRPEQHLRASVQAAVRSCPARALTLSED
jgi:ferredoxin